MEELRQGGGNGSGGAAGGVNEKRQNTPFGNVDDGHSYSLNPSYDTSTRNPDMHAVLKSMMDPVLACTTLWRLNGLCKASGFADMRKFPRCSNNCYRWMLGTCESKPGDPARCIVRP